MMSKIDLKKRIVEAGMAKMASVVKDFQKRINELKAVTTKDESFESVSQTEDRKNADLELLDSLATQLDFALSEFQVLERINPETLHEKVDFGAIVVTDKRKLFVSTGIENFEVDDVEYFGLSTNAPLYKNMAGSEVGAQVSFHGIEYKILEIF